LAFVSYARTDLAVVEQLRDGLATVGCQAWIDLQTGGRQDWWATILTQIRGCDLFIAALSTTSLESIPCTRERDYAAALGKPVLPVQVTPVSTRILPPFLARLTVVDFTRHDLTTGLRLAAAVNGMPPAPRLPDPLPPEPPLPLPYPAQLSERVHSPQLDFDEQMALTVTLRDALTRPADRDDTLGLVKAFLERDDLYAKAHHQLQDLLSAPRPAEPAISRPAPSGQRQAPVQPFPTGTARTLRTLTGHAGPVLSVAFSPDGALLATTSEDTSVRLWNPATGDHVRTLNGHTRAVHGVAFSPDGTLLATAGNDTTVRLWG
jgi:hypothetical protein